MQSPGNAIGRMNYSVKFVSFNSLLNPQGSNPNGERSFNLINDPDADGDVGVLQH